jgi:hypothetical protein
MTTTSPDIVGALPEILRARPDIVMLLVCCWSCLAGCGDVLIAFNAHGFEVRAAIHCQATHLNDIEGSPASQG